MEESNKLKLGLPKGSLEEATIKLFEKAGFKIRKRSRNYFPEINDPQISISLCRVQEMGDYIARGILDAGIMGLDWLEEGGNTDKVVKMADLVYSKNSNRPCRWVLAVAGDSPYNSPQDLEGKRIATEVKGLAKRYFDKLGIKTDIDYSFGATEAKVVEGLADGIVEVTETGATIKAHGLKILDEIMLSYPVLAANFKTMENEAKRKKLEDIIMLLQGALRAEDYVALKMNAPAENLEAILEMLPALNSPTLSPLKDDKWHSLEIVVKANDVRDLIPALKAAGAEGIIEYSLNKVI